MCLQYSNTDVIEKDIANALRWQPLSTNWENMEWWFIFPAVSNLSKLVKLSNWKGHKRIQANIWMPSLYYLS